MIWQLPMLLLPADGAERIQGWGVTWGLIGTKHDQREQVLVVSTVSQRDAVTLSTMSSWQSDHYLRYADSVPGSGLWYQVTPDLHDLHTEALLRDGLGIELDTFRGAVVNGWRMPPQDRPIPVLTWSPIRDSSPRWSLWWVSREGAAPGLLEVVNDASPLLDLATSWPIEDLSQATIVIVGLGSIGSIIAETLASYAIGRLLLVDHDRFLQHNVARHRLGKRHIGRHKVFAMAEYLKGRFPDLSVEPYPSNAIFEADLLRPIIEDADVVVGATDGVASRRVINHLARRAGKPAVLACVLESGALGEIVRVRQPTGCLLCLRAALVERGSMDPEPALDQDYDLGPPHLPMTAVAGDLANVGTLAAKISVATILEHKGHWNQRLPGDVAIIGLRPVPNLPSPFNIEQVGMVHWTEIGPSRPECPTCAPI